MTQQYERIGTLALEEVFPFIDKHINDIGKFRVDIKGYSVKVLSLRLRTFLKNGVQCPCCSNKGSFFAVEKTLGNKGGYHLNLYGYDQNNEEVLFTHDHIQARALGGADDLSNSRTMCGPCNWEKGRIEGQLKKSTCEEEKAELQEQLKKFMP